LAGFRYLPQWVEVLSLHVQAWASRTAMRPRRAETLPAPFAARALKGEGILRCRLYDWFDEQGWAEPYPDRLLLLWQQLWVEGQELRFLCERIGLSKVASQHVSLPQVDWPVLRQLYCVLLESLTEEGCDDLLTLATDRVFLLAFVKSWPADASQPERVTLPTLRLRTHHHVQKALAKPVKLREKFSTEADSASFTLRVSVDKGPWLDVFSASGKRLKPLKMQAYETVLGWEGEQVRRVVEAEKAVVFEKRAR